MDEEMQLAEMEQRWRARAVRYCAAGEQCSAAVRDKLADWGATASATERIMRYLIENQYVDDGRYCHLYCDSKVRLQKWGRVKIAASLRAKRLEASAIDEAIDAIDEEEYQSMLLGVAQSKWDSLTESDPRKRQAKLLAFLAQRGFTRGEALAALRAVEQ